MSEQIDTFSVISWNILLERKRRDLVRAQYQRLGAIAAKLASLDVDLDIVTLQEAEGDNGDEIAKLTDNSAGKWYRHSRKNEHVGMFGAKVGETNPIELGPNRVAVATNYNGVEVVGGHLRYGFKLSDLRIEQVGVLLDYLEDHEKAVVAMDFNDLPGRTARKMLLDAGFESAFVQQGGNYPKTLPVKKYHRTGELGRISRVWPTLPIDDIYVRGVGVTKTGMFGGESDHYGLYATIDTQA